MVLIYPGGRSIRVPAFWLVRLSALSAQQAVKTGVEIASMASPVGVEDLVIAGAVKAVKGVKKAETALERGVDATDDLAGAGRVLSPSEVVEHGTAAEFKVAGEAHHVYFGPSVSGKIELQLCSRNCAALRDKVTEMLRAVPEGHAAREELTQILTAAQKVLDDLEANALTIGAADARAELLAKQLGHLSKKYPSYIDPNVASYETRVQRWSSVSQHSDEIASELNKFDSSANFTAEHVDEMIASWADAKHGSEGHHVLNSLENARYGDLSPAQADELAAAMRGPGHRGSRVDAADAVFGPDGDIVSPLGRGTRREDIEMGFGVPGGGLGAKTFDDAVDLPTNVEDLLRELDIHSIPALKRGTPHEAHRLEIVLANNKYPKKAGKEVPKAAAQWAADGITRPADFVNRWEYTRTRFGEIVEKLLDTNAPLPRGQSRQAVAADMLIGEMKNGSLSTKLRPIPRQCEPSQVMASSKWAEIRQTKSSPASKRMPKA